MFTCCCWYSVPPYCIETSCPPAGLSSLDSAAIGSYSPLCGTPAVPATSKALCQPDSIPQCSAGLQIAAAVQQKAVKPSTNQAPHSAVTELINWLHHLNIADSSMKTVTPEDMLVFVVQHGSPIMLGSATSSTQHVAAPNSLATIKSHFSKELELLGRTGAWDPQRQHGNPVESLHLSSLSKAANSMLQSLDTTNEVHFPWRNQK